MSREGLGAAITTLSKGFGAFVEGKRLGREEQRLFRLEAAEQAKAKRMEDLKTFDIWVKSGWVPVTKGELEKIQDIHPDEIMTMDVPRSVREATGVPALYKLTPEQEQAMELETEEKKYEIRSRSALAKAVEENKELKKKLEAYEAGRVAEAKARKEGRDVTKHITELREKHRTFFSGIEQKFYGRLKDELQNYKSRLNVLDVEEAERLSKEFKAAVIDIGTFTLQFLRPFHLMNQVELEQPYGGFYGARKAVELLTEGVTTDFEANLEREMSQEAVAYRRALISRFGQEMLDKGMSRERINNEITQATNRFGRNYVAGGMTFYRVFSEPGLSTSAAEAKREKKPKPKKKQIPWGAPGEQGVVKRSLNEFFRQRR